MRPHLPLLALAAMLPATPAAGGAGATDTDARRCLLARQQGVAAVARGGLGDARRCLAKAARGRLESTVEACVAGGRKRTRALDRALARAGRRCAGVDVPFGPQGDAVLLEAAAGGLPALDGVLGPNLDVALRTAAADPAGATCQKDLARKLEGCVATALGAFQRCATRGLAGKEAPPGAALPFAGASDLARCLGHDPRGRLARRCDGALDAAAVGCRGLDADVALPGCAGAGDAGLGACFAGRAAAGVCELVDRAGALGADCRARAGPLHGRFLALSYNVAGLPEGISSSMPAAYTPLISPLLNFYDLVLVQESWLTPEPNPLEPLRTYHELLVVDADHPFQSVPLPAPLGNDPERPSALVSDGLNRLSHFPFLPAVRERWVDCFGQFDHGADCLSLKGFSVATTTLAPGVAVDVYNLHVEAGGGPEDELVREDSVTQLADFVNAFSAGRAVVMGGDFNLHSDEDPDRELFERLLAETGLVDVCAALACPEPGRIDKFLFRSSAALEIAPLSWSFEVERFRSPAGDPLSDHDALAVRFAWRVPSDP